MYSGYYSSQAPSFTSYSSTLEVTSGGANKLTSYRQALNYTRES